MKYTTGRKYIATKKHPELKEGTVIIRIHGGWVTHLCRLHLLQNEINNWLAAKLIKPHKERLYNEKDMIHFCFYSYGSCEGEIKEDFKKWKELTE